MRHCLFRCNGTIVLVVSLLGIVAGAASAQQEEIRKPVLQVTGDIGVGFGQLSYEKGTQQVRNASVTPSLTANYDGFSELTTAYDTRLKFVYGNEQAGAAFMLRARGSQSGSIAAQNSNGSGPQGFGALNSGATDLEDLYGEVYWSPTRAFNLTAGRLIGPLAFAPLAGSYVIANPVYNGPELWMSWTGVNGLVATYDGGFWQAGVGIATQCVPSCGSFSVTGSALSNLIFGGYGSSLPVGGAVQSAIGYNANVAFLSPDAIAQRYGLNGNNVTPLLVNKNTQTLDPFISAHFKSVTVRAHAPFTQGDFTQIASLDGSHKGSVKTVSGDGYSVGVAWNGVAGLVLAGEYQTFTDHKNSGVYEGVYTQGGLLNCNSGPGSCAAIRDGLRDINRTAVVFKAAFFGAELNYMDMTVDNGRSDCTTYTNVFSYGFQDSRGSTGNSCRFGNQWVRVGYVFPAGIVQVIPEYSQVTLGKQGQQKVADTNTFVLPGDQTNQLVRVILRVEF